MLDAQLKTQLAAYLERVTQPFELVASLDESETSAQMRELLTTIQSLRSDKITLREDGNDARKPSFTLQRQGSDSSLRFAGLPLGHEFTSLVLALLWTGGHPPKEEQDLLDQIRGLHEPGLPQLPGRGAGAVAHGHPEPPHQNHRHRRRCLPQRGGSPRNHGRAHGVPQWRGVWRGPHAAGRNRRQAGHRRGQTRSGQTVGQRGV